MIYAQLNDDKICIAVTQTSREIKGHNVIELLEYDNSIIGSKYINDKWVKQSEPEETVPEPTPEELIGQQLVDMEIQSLLDNMQAQEERAILGQQITDIEISLMLGGI